MTNSRPRPAAAADVQRIPVDAGRPAIVGPPTISALHPGHGHAGRAHRAGCRRFRRAGPTVAAGQDWIRTMQSAKVVQTLLAPVTDWAHQSQLSGLA
jgi:hypothetical protein